MIDLEEALVWYDAVWAYHDLGIDFNMPQGPVDYSTLAPAQEGRYVTNGVYTIIPGLHTLAAEVHQASTTSSNVLFGAAFETVLRAPPRVRLTRNSNSNLQVQAVSGVIESAPSLDGPWSFGIWGGPYEVPPIDSARFYRARRD